jgi:hypothetical protein
MLVCFSYPLQTIQFRYGRYSPTGIDYLPNLENACCPIPQFRVPQKKQRYVFLPPALIALPDAKLGRGRLLFLLDVVGRVVAVGHCPPLTTRMLRAAA